MARVDPPCVLTYHTWKGGDLILSHSREVQDIRDAWVEASRDMVAGGSCFCYGKITCIWKGVRQFVMEID